MNQLKRRSLRALFVIFCTAYISGCGVDPILKPPGKIIVDNNPKLKMEFIRFKDNGSMREPSELVSIERAIQSKRWKTIIVYVHGWNNNVETNDVEDMQTALKNLNKGFPNESKLVVYAGWEGKSHKGAAHYFTLNGRRKAARKIGQENDFRKLVQTVSRTGRKQGSTVVVVGHSLGAALVENNAALMIPDEKERDENLPHLYMLVNSAELGKSHSSKNIIKINKSDRVKNQQLGTRLCKPYVVSITSVEDKALKKLLVVNSFFSGHGIKRSLGFTNRLLTHDMFESDGRDRRDSIAASMRPALAPSVWSKKDNGAIHQWRISARSNTANRNGFWNFQVPADLITDHNDVYNDQVIALINSMVRFSNERASGFPQDLEEILRELKGITKKNYQDDYVRGGRSSEMIYGTALRLPQNKLTISKLLSELESLNPVTSRARSDWQSRYASQLFKILMLNHNPEAWDKELFNRLKDVLLKKSEDGRRHMMNALESSGRGDCPRADENLMRFLDLVTEKTGVVIFRGKCGCEIQTIREMP